MKRIVILGAGYAGLTALFELRRRLDRRDAEIVLVNQNPFHTFITELHTLAGGDRRVDEVTVALHELERRGIGVKIAAVEKIDWRHRSVQLGDGSMEYDYCLAGLGSHPETYGIDGVLEHSLFLYNLNSAKEIRDRLSDLYCKSLAQDQSFEVVIAGGGLTGIELAGEIAHHYRGRLHCTILEATNQLIPGFDPHLADIAEARLRGMGVAILKNDPIDHVRTKMAQMKSGSRIPFDLMVWSAGVRANPLITKSGFQVDRRGRGLIDEYLHSVDDAHVYMVGDCAALCDPVTKRPLPPTAQLAMQSGRHAAEMVHRVLHNHVELAFMPEIKGFFASLGPGTGIGKIGNIRLQGKPAWLVKWMIEAQHAIESAGADQAVQRLYRPKTKMDCVGKPGMAGLKG